MRKTVHSLIQSEYARRQLEIQNQLAMKREETAARIPEILGIESRIQLAGVRFNKGILLGTLTQAEASEELAITLENLRREKKQLLLEAGFPEDFMEPRYICKKCSDTGYVEADGTRELCTCYRQKLIDHLYSQSNLKLAERDNFRCFDENLYSDTVDQARFGMDISPRENILNIRRGCEEFIESFQSPSGKNLFFSGPTGVGKTFMSNCIARELINRGITVLYQTAPMLFHTLNEYKMKAMKEEDYQDSAYKDIFEVELLVIDDLGTESGTASRYAELLNILNIRQVNNLSKPCKTIISTNIGIKELYEYYDERIASRVIGGFDLYRFFGQDIRAIQRTSR